MPLFPAHDSSLATRASVSQQVDANKESERKAVRRIEGERFGFIVQTLLDGPSELPVD